ncbi:hypothetical protein [Kutzneria sp. NPDC051319]|uniref:hypothetical protein n=1 Tax=Kutzneria sp. NPDC051319 TaxID=3155047 RepID=UPI003440DEBF
MTATITPRDETAAVTTNGYRYDRVVETAGRIVRARVLRARYYNESLAVAEVLTEHLTWTRIADDDPVNWWHSTRTPSPRVDPAAVLGPVADQLLRRAATILAPVSTTPTLSPHVLDAVGALVATTYRYDGEQRITPDDMAWATTHGGRLHVIEHDDGSVTFTKAHRDQCPFITSSATQDCDGECDVEDPADAQRRLGR